jgi:hypothetical protein
MKASKWIALATLAGLIVVGPSASMCAEEPKKSSEAPKREAKSEESSAPVYKPPHRGAPGGRVGGGTRGAPGRDIFVLSVLAPDHTGLTTKEQPSLFWFISSQTSLTLELTIVDPNAIEPLLETRIAAPVTRGVHRLRLADFGVRLAIGVPYQWSVAVVPDPARRSRDILASGTIERIESVGGLEPKVATGSKEELVSQYAEAGIWYDALETVCDLIEGSPGDARPRRYRAALLTQAGLPEIAE